MMVYQLENRTRIIIIDDEQSGCKDIKDRLSEIANLDIVGVFYNTQESIDWLKTNTADIAIVDYYMPGLHGIPLIKRFKKNYRNMKLITITSERNAYLLNQVNKSGNDALLVKGPINYISEAVCCVSHGWTFVQPEFSRSIALADEDIKKVECLTVAQRFCFEKIASGKTIKEIARLKKATPNAIKNYLFQCRKKFEVKTTQELINLYHKFFPKEKIIL